MREKTQALLWGRSCLLLGEESEDTFAKAQRVRIISEVSSHSVLSTVQVSRYGLWALPRENVPSLLP